MTTPLAWPLDTNVISEMVRPKPWIAAFRRQVIVAGLFSRGTSSGDVPSVFTVALRQDSRSTRVP